MNWKQLASIVLQYEPPIKILHLESFDIERKQGKIFWSKEHKENELINKKIYLCTGIKEAGLNYAAIRAPNQFFIYIKVLYWKKEKKKEIK